MTRSLKSAIARAERKHIEAALEAYEGNISRVAEVLEISRRVLTRKIAEHDLHDFAAKLRAKAGVSGPR